VNLSARDLTGSLGKATVDKATQLGRGATATVHPARLGGHVYAAKLFLEGQPFPTSKVLAMLANPPTRLKEQGRDRGAVRLAWPVAILSDDKGRDVGLLMPVVDLKASYPLDYFYDQTLFKKLNAPNEAALSFKLEIALNLSSLVAELHEHGHYFIDMKPQNIRVTLGSHEISLLDCDGFSIAGPSGTRHAAELLSTDYISPEAFRGNTPPSALGEPQDRYALAVLLFQLLNRGTHPFQGIPTGESVDVATNDEKAARGMYPHGRSPHPTLIPRPHSIHGLFDDGLRALFDQAFVGGADSRPSAKDWAHKFNQLLTSKALVRCVKFPNDVAHLRFRDKQCPACYLASIPAIKTSLSTASKVRAPSVETAPLSPVPPRGQAPNMPTLDPLPILSFIVVILGIPVALVVLGALARAPQPADQRDPPGQTCTASFSSQSPQQLCELYWEDRLVQCDKQIVEELYRRQLSVSPRENCGVAVGSELGQPTIQETPPGDFIEIPMDGANSTGALDVMNRPASPAAPPTPPAPLEPPPALPTPPAVVRVAPKLDIRRSPPTDDFYPPSARREEIEGVTTVRACVGPDGRTSGEPTVTKTSGNTALDEAAAKWARRARWTAGTEDGSAVEMCSQFNVRFKLKD
jgi:TonB family protein